MMGRFIQDSKFWPEKSMFVVYLMPFTQRDFGQVHRRPILGRELQPAWSIL